MPTVEKVSALQDANCLCETNKRGGNCTAHLCVYVCICIKMIVMIKKRNHFNNYECMTVRCAWVKTRPTKYARNAYWKETPLPAPLISVKMILMIYVEIVGTDRNRKKKPEHYIYEQYSTICILNWPRNFIFLLLIFLSLSVGFFFYSNRAIRFSFFRACASVRGKSVG